MGQWRRFIAAGFLLLPLPKAFLFGADKLVQPVGLIVETTGARIRHATDSSLLGAHRGDIIQPGDQVVTDSSGSAAIVFCPTKSLFQVQKASTVTFSSREYAVKGQSTAQGTIPICSLPEIFVNNHSGDEGGASQRETLQGKTPVPTDFEARVAALPADVRTQILASVGPLNNAVGRNSLDVLALLARATLYQRAGLYYDAGNDFQKAGQLLGSPAWIAPLVNRVNARGVRPRVETSAPAIGKKTYALVVGVSKFANISQNLQYADQDALSFADYLRLPRGGGLKDDLELKLLTNEQATTSAIRNGLVDFLIAHATPADTVILFVASHGVIENKTDDAYILSNESDLEKLSSTAIPMEQLLELLDSSRCHAGRVLIFVDVCHADRVGSFRSRVGGPIEKVLRSGNSGVFAFAASRASEVSREGAQYGGGHGAFSYFLLRGLNSIEPNEEAKPDTPTVTLDRLIQYVRNRVRAATETKQNPTEMGDLDRNLDIVSDIHLPVLPLLDYPTRAIIATNATRGVESLSTVPPEIERFRDAIAAGRLLPGEAQGAFDQLPRLRALFGDNRAGYLAEENRLRVALENAGQQVLMRYLKGDEIAQSSVDFDGCAKTLSAAFQLTPEAFPLESDSFFCQGRSLIGQHRYAEAMPLLERAVKLTPGEAYVWNALGIGYLQVPDYERAADAFRDAIRRAPFWAYPRHNLALALREAGDLSGAIDQYIAAIELAPQYSYLRYNLGLLYQQINDRGKATLRYREALDRAPGEAARARVMIAQATLDADRGRVAEALRSLDDAARLRLDREDLFTLRHNRALILAHDDRRRAEAEALWNANLRDDPDYLPSMLALAEAMEHWGATDRAVSLYRDILARRTRYVAARLKLAALLGPSDPTAARMTIEQGIAEDPRQPQLFESLGDNRKAAGSYREAIAAYCKAFGYSNGIGSSAKIAKKLKELHSRPSDCPASGQ